MTEINEKFSLVQRRRLWLTMWNIFLNERKMIQINFICESKFSKKSNITPALVFKDEKKEAIT